MKSMSRSELVDFHLGLLELERKAEEERQEQLREDGEPVLELIADRIYEQLGAYVVTVRHESNGRLPKHSIDHGSRVAVLLNSNLNADLENGGHEAAVVTKVAPDCMTLVFSYNPCIGTEDTVFIMQTENSIHTQLSDAMRWLKDVDTSGSGESAAPVVKMMFKEHRGDPADAPTKSSAPPYFINPRLDGSQRQAVGLALSHQPLTVIHGPPGAGKTTTIVEVILQHVERGQRVLVCAPSNKAVDNLLEGLWKQTNKAVCKLSMDDVIRLGHLARMDATHRRFSHTVKVNKRMQNGSRRMKKDETQARNAEMGKLLREAIVVMSTLTCVRSVALQLTYDLLVIDECAQATEAACWLAIPYARKVVLAGDPCQLPPTILSQEAARRGLKVSLMERQMDLHRQGVVQILDTQYRMHQFIQAWSSNNLYGGRLKAAPEVASRLLPELPDVRSTKQTEPTLLLVDTAGCNLMETQNVNTSSFNNPGEADLVVSHAKSLVGAGLPEEDIGVITPYKQQVKLIASKMRATGLDVEVNSVDGYQGREKEAILLSLVRSNERGQVGFVGDRRRLNVAVTRARRHLFVICDVATVCQNKTIRSLVDHMKRRGESRSAYGVRDPSEEEGGRSDAGPAPLVSASVVLDQQETNVRKPIRSSSSNIDVPAARSSTVEVPDIRSYSDSSSSARVPHTPDSVYNTRRCCCRIL